MKTSKKILCVILSALTALSFSGCGKKEPKEQYRYVEYTAEHTSTSSSKFVNFVSTDSGLDAFINEFAERHMRCNPATAVYNGSYVGAGQTAWKDMESKVSGWWNASAQNGLTDNFIINWLRDGKQDNQGYVWCDAGGALSSWSLGWAFPSYNEFGKAWDFKDSSDTNDWFVSESLGDVTADDANFNKTTANSQMIVKPKTGVESIVLTSGTFGVRTMVSPFFRVGLAYSPAAGDNVEDLYVYYQTSEEKTWTEDKKVSFSDFCTTGFEIGGSAIPSQGYFFPMYLQDKWGVHFSGAHRTRTITNVRLVLKAKEGTKLNGTFAVDYVANEFDDRQMQYPAYYITSAKNFLSYKRDADTLSRVLPKARAAMNFMLNQGNGKNGLVSQEYFAGHFVDGMGRDYTGLGSGYWDIIALPTVNLMMNTAFYNALNDMIYLEEMAAAMNISAAKQSVQTVNAQMNGYDVYSPDTAQSLYALRDAFPAKFQAEFWNEETGRFHAGHYDNESSLAMDHGYLTFNEQAIIAGLATDAQTKKIMQWIDGERTVKGDNSTGEDIYYYECAPRSNTQDIGTDFYWATSESWDGNVQNGGSAVHLSYYDIFAESKVNATKSLAKLKNIQSWYEKVKAAGGEGTQFYRAYYNNASLNTKNIILQGGNTSGTLGLDYEFLEAALLFCAIPDAYFGLGTLSSGALTFAPNMPDGLDWWRMENLTYNGMYYDVTVSKYFLEISEVKTMADGAAITADPIHVTMRVPGFAYEVYVNGEKAEPKLNGDGTFTVTMPFANGKVEIKEPVKA